MCLFFRQSKGEKMKRVKKKNGPNWYFIDAVVGLISGVSAIVGIFTGYKSLSEQDALNDLRLEDKYGLKVREDYEED